MNLIIKYNDHDDAWIQYADSAVLIVVVKPQMPNQTGNKLWAKANSCYDRTAKEYGTQINLYFRPGYSDAIIIIMLMMMMQWWWWYNNDVDRCNNNAIIMIDVMWCDVMQWSMQWSMRGDAMMQWSMQ